MGKNTPLAVSFPFPNGKVMGPLSDPSIKLRVPSMGSMIKEIALPQPLGPFVAFFRTASHLIRTGRCQRLVQHRIDAGPPRSRGCLVGLVPTLRGFAGERGRKFSPDRCGGLFGGRSSSSAGKGHSEQAKDGTTRLRCARVRHLPERWIATCHASARNGAFVNRNGDLPFSIHKPDAPRE